MHTVDRFIYMLYAPSMSTTTIRVAKSTRDAIKSIAIQRNESLAETVARGARLLQQEQLGLDLAHPLDPGEREWLDADAG